MPIKMRESHIQRVQLGAMTSERKTNGQMLKMPICLEINFEQKCLGHLYPSILTSTNHTYSRKKLYLLCHHHPSQLFLDPAGQLLNKSQLRSLLVADPARKLLTSSPDLFVKFFYPKVEIRMLENDFSVILVERVNFEKAKLIKGTAQKQRSRFVHSCPGLETDYW